MTEAYVSKNVNSTTDTAATNEDGQNTNRNNTIEENCLPDSLKTNLKCNCNETNDSKVETQIQSNIATNSSNNLTNTIEIPQNNQSAIIGTTDLNTLLKYMYKKREAKNEPTKTTGHPKNTLRRRKRSENLDNLHGTKAPLIVNYETSHGLPRDVEIWLPVRNTGNVIKHSALADFNIETLHDNEPLKKNIHGPSTETIPENANDSNESVDRENYRNDGAKSETNSEESNEQNNESSENSSENEQYQKNNEKYSDSRENYRNENKNDETDRRSPIELENADLKSSEENGDSKEYYDKSKYTTPPYREKESTENSSEETDKPNAGYSSNDERPNSEELNSKKYKSQERHQYEPEYVAKTSPPTKIQDVDLGEYDRIQVNEHGKIESAKDTRENTAFDPAIDVILTTKPDKGINQNEKITSLSKDNTGSTSLESHDHNEPTHINDGEVKPVVEINSDSTESSDENSNEALKAKLENESLETLTGVNDESSSENSDKLQEDSNKSLQSDVKQQFERIPMNYNHADKTPSKDSNVEHVEAKEQTNDNDNEEGTIDKVKPRYDENLNIKFDDISIKLPEIKLPDDILSYAYENPPVYKDEQREKPTYYQDSSIYKKDKKEQRENPTYYKDSSIYDKNKKDQVVKPEYYRNDKEENENPRFYNYSDEDEDEPPAQIKQKEDDEESNYGRHGYYGYNAGEKEKEDYKQKQSNNDGENEDLYEKFVRERFGKRGTFEKRLEKLTDYKANNPHLYQKVQKILKKTKDVKSEAEKSGDPNAGYMWTLEYGEKL